MSYIYLCVNTKIPNFCKVGRTSKHIDTRLKGLNSCGVYGYWIKYKIWEVLSNDVNRIESTIHTNLSKYLAKDSPGKETYEINPEICKYIIQLYVYPKNEPELVIQNVYKHKGIAMYK